MFTRRDIAIRDFFDYWHAKKASGINGHGDHFVRMVAKKITVSTTPFVALTGTRVAQLERQLVTDLRPVLTERDFRATSARNCRCSRGPCVHLAFNEGLRVTLCAGAGIIGRSVQELFQGRLLTRPT